MNRRNFLKDILIAGASFNVLPGAGRIWKAQRDTSVEVAVWSSYAECFYAFNLQDKRFELRTKDGRVLETYP